MKSLNYIVNLLKRDSEQASLDIHGMLTVIHEKTDAYDVVSAFLSRNARLMRAKVVLDVVARPLAYVQANNELDAPNGEEESVFIIVSSLRRELQSLTTGSLYTCAFANEETRLKIQVLAELLEKIGE